MEYTLDQLDTDKADNILAMHFGYYAKLSAGEKQRFVTRVMDFIARKKFEPRENADLSAGLDNIKVLIAAAAVQLTFGLDKYELGHFAHIFIYPTAYYNNMTKHWHKGETNVMGAIVFSWKDLMAGNENPDDGINLGLHEMAHALLLGRRIDSKGDEFFKAYFDKWWAVSNSEFLKLEDHQKSMFRDYGGTNPQEFFAVCVECFFEIPGKFKEEHPEIYRQTCILLNQDPSAEANDLVKGRQKMLSAIPEHIEPKNLQLEVGDGDTSGAAFGMIFGVLAGLFFLVAGIITSTGGMVFIGVMLVAIMAMVIRRSNVAKFYFYDNTLVVGLRSVLGSENRRITFAPEEIVKIRLQKEIVKSVDLYFFNVYYIDGLQIINERYDYTGISGSQREILEKMAQDFCKIHQIGFVKEY